MKKRRPLRGQPLVDSALRHLSDVASWASPNEPLTWDALAKRVGVSRQAVATKPAITAAFCEAKENIRKFSGDYFSPEKIHRRNVAEQIDELKQTIADLTRERDGWIERWVQVEANARKHAIDADILFQPVVKPDRARIGAR